MGNLTELHCHCLPCVDDGPDSVDHALALLEKEKKCGVNQLVFTPHFYPERGSVEEFLQRRQAAARLLPPDPELQVRYGAEIRYTPFLPDYPLEQLAFSGYVLVELHPFLEPVECLKTIEKLKDRGFTPIFAHVERFPYLQSQPKLLYQWVKAGALAQVNADWVLSGGKNTAIRWFSHHLIHVMASDAHSMQHRPPRLDEGMRRLPGEMADQLQKNASDIFAGRSVEAFTPTPMQHRWYGWR